MPSISPELIFISGFSFALKLSGTLMLLLRADSSTEAWREPVRSRESGSPPQMGRIVQHVTPNPRAEAWPLESYTRTWFYCLVAIELLSVLIYMVAFLVGLGCFPTTDLGFGIIDTLMLRNWYAAPVVNIGVIIFYAALFACLETVRFRGTWHTVLMEIMPKVLVVACCAGQCVYMFFS